MRKLFYSLCGCLLVAFLAVGAERFSTQEPEVAEARVRGEAAKPAPAAGKGALDAGPDAVWIWGPEADGRYVLRKAFPGGAKAAWLRATCDNRMTVYLNGKVVARSDSWENPTDADISKHLVPGDNVLEAQVSNAGGPSGFALKLALTDGEGKVRHVISDNSWIAAAKRGEKEGAKVRTLGKMGTGPWGNVFAAGAGLPGAPRGVFEVLPGFQVEKLYTVPRDTQGSWVCIAFDPKGRLIASDQGGKGLFRVTPPPLGGKGVTKVEPLDVKITAAQGMLFAFDSLYLSVNGGPGSGFYRARDTNNDDQYDEVVKLKALRGGGEHGPHALRLAPDGKSIYLIAGNHTDPPADFAASRVPRNWKEDLLLPRQWDARGHARGRLAPGGWIARTDPDGKEWEIVSTGYRNAYDMDFNADGELFAYDADMEWDMGTPWYRPTRVVHAASGSEFGWRSGTGKWPTWYPDSLPQLIDIGPGSPVGVTFGYGTKFPAKYQKALYILDWTFGTMYAIHIEPDGASYRATREEFVSRTPLPLTDAAVGPDGALYFTIGGRGTQSELYRVTYVGKESTAPVEARDEKFADLRAIRRELEAFHRRAEDQAKAVEAIWQHLGHPDRHIRYAARVALEHQDVKHWQERALAEKDPARLITAMLALARQGDHSLQPRVLAALDRIPFGALDEPGQLALLRAWSLVFIRLEGPSEKVAKGLGRKLGGFYPARSDALNRELCSLLCYLKWPGVVSKTVALMKAETKYTPEDIAELLARNRGYGGTIARMLANMPEIQKLHYAFALRTMPVGWTPQDRVSYYRWLREAHKRSGGASYTGFLTNIEKEAWNQTKDTERLAVEASGVRAPFRVKALPKPKGPGKDWKLAEVLALTKTKWKDRDYNNGERAYSAGRCVICHRFLGDGGATGPDLSQLAGRFTLKDLAEAIFEPSKVISDQYQASVVATTKGKVYTGKVVSEDAESVTLLIDPEDSTKVVKIAKSEIEERNLSPVSLMPADLLREFNEDEVLDLLAYLLSRGNPRDPLFKRR